ncbi:MAG: LPS assembly lipoprotein LptE [Planctomycetota bacterium]
MKVRTDFRDVFGCTILVLLAVGTLITTGCGYSSQGLIRDDIQSVAIDVFDNETKYRGLEVELTRRLSEEIRHSTPLDIVPKSEADSILSGVLVDFDQRNETETEKEEVLLRRVMVTVSFQWMDNLTGQDLVSSNEFSQQNFFALSRDEPIAPRVFKNTAEKIVEKMEHSW